MASTAFLKESGSSESCSFQATYRQPHFFWAQQETGDSFHAHGFRPPTEYHLHTCTDTHTVPCCFYEEEGLLSSTAPAVTSQMFPVITSMNCLPPCCFLSISLSCTELPPSQILASDQIVQFPLQSCHSAGWSEQWLILFRVEKKKKKKGI